MLRTRRVIAAPEMPQNPITLALVLDAPMLFDCLELEAVPQFDTSSIGETAST
jgi:hypothetical protein